MIKNIFKKIKKCGIIITALVILEKICFYKLGSEIGDLYINTLGNVLVEYYNEKY